MTTIIDINKIVILVVFVVFFMSSRLFSNSSIKYLRKKKIMIFLFVNYKKKKTVSYFKH